MQGTRLSFLARTTRRGRSSHFGCVSDKHSGGVCDNHLGGVSGKHLGGVWQTCNTNAADARSSWGLGMASAMRVLEDDQQRLRLVLAKEVFPINTPKPPKPEPLSLKTQG
jgi:hypothetical protein